MSISVMHQLQMWAGAELWIQKIESSWSKTESFYNIIFAFFLTLNFMPLKIILRSTKIKTAQPAKISPNPILCFKKIAQRRTLLVRLWL